MRTFLIPIMVCFSLLTAEVVSGENRLLQGSIVEESGKPVPGAELFVYDSQKTRRPADYISPKTTSDGRFSIPLPEGKYWVIARLRHGDKYGPLLLGDLHSGEPLALDLAQPLQNVTLTVTDIRESSRAKEKRQSEMPTLSGRILDQSGLPVAAAAVCAWREPVTERLPDLVSAWTETEGEYTLYLLPGRYSVSAATSFPPPAADLHLVPLTVAEGQKTVALNLLLINSKVSSSGGVNGASATSPQAD